MDFKQKITRWNCILIRIKILHLITDLDTGGAEVMLTKLVSYMNKARFTNVVVSMTDNGTLGNKIEQMGIKLYTLKMTRGVPNPLSLYKFYKIIQAEKPDIIQTWLYHADLLGYLITRLYRKPLIWNIRCSDMNLNKYSFLTRLVLKFCIEFSSYPASVIVNSYTGKGAHESLGYRPRQWRILPNGFELERFQLNPSSANKMRTELGIGEDVFVIGLVGRDDPMKDYNNLVQAAGNIIDKIKIDTKILFVLAGRGLNKDNKELMQLLFRYEVTSYFYLLGEHNNIPELMTIFDLFCSSSLSEGFPNVIGEAMAAGIPCVVTDAGDSALIVGDTGKVVPVASPIDLSQAIIFFYEIGNMARREMGMRARKRIEDNFDIRDIASQYEKVYEETMLCVE